MTATDDRVVKFVGAGAIPLYQTGPTSWEADIPAGLGTHHLSLAAYDGAENQSAIQDVTYTGLQVVFTVQKSFQDWVLYSTPGKFYIKVCGIASMFDTQGFYLDDGSGVWLRINCQSYSGLSDYDRVTVRGVVSGEPDQPALVVQPQNVHRVDY